MARQRRGMEEEDQELNLAPFMNMVVILIPLLLLSVVFLKVGVINITAPELSVGPPSDKQPEEDEEEPLNLTIAIDARGFQLGAKAAMLPELDGCPKPGPTICLEDREVDVAAKFEEARKAYENDQEERGMKVLKEGMEAYNYRELYNQLAKIKEEYPDETVVNLSADSDIPYAVLVRVMDTARYKLEKDSYDSTSDYLAAGYETQGQQYAELFSDPILSVVQ